MKAVVKFGIDLSQEERNLLSVAYKNSVNPRRSSLKVLSSIEEKQQEDDFKTKLIQDYRVNVEKELDKFCYDIVSLIDDNLVPQADNSECKVFFLKMKGDYYRYINEYTKGENSQKISESAFEAYNEATELAERDLKTTNSIRLSNALNFSVFQYEILNDPSKACEMAKQAFDDAIDDIEDLKEDQYKNSTIIMQLIRDNLTLWISELVQNNDDD